MDFGINKSEWLISSSSVLLLSHKSPISCSSVTSVTREYFSPHYRDYPEIWYCRKGEYTHHTELGDFSCKAGSVVIIPPGILSQPDIPVDGDVLVQQIRLPFDAYGGVSHDAYINSITHLQLPCFSKELGFSLPCSAELSEESRRAAEKLLESPTLKDLERFFSLPEFKLSDEQKISAQNVVQSRLLPVLRAISHINANYSLKITAEDLCKVSELCRTNLLNVFKRYLGISHSVYLVMLRVIRAQFAIAHTQYSLQYISDMCGFATSSYMSKCYKKYKGFLPKVDRAKMKMYRKKYPHIHVSHNYFLGDE